MTEAEIEALAHKRAADASDEWLRLQERERLDANRRPSFSLADTIVTIARVADLMGLTHEDAAALYMNVSTAFARVVERKGTVN